MSKFAEKLASDKFLITAELNPPKSVYLDRVLRKGEQLREFVDAVNVTDSQSAIMTTGPVAMAHLLLDRGIEPIIQFTGRDRNQIALQADMLSAYVLGVENMLCLSGDPPNAGDHPNAKGVFDLDGVALVKAATSLMKGLDLGGNDVKGAPTFCVGAAVNPGASDMEKEIYKMEQKVEEGAVFFQSQAIFDPEVFGQFVARTQHINIPILGGVILLKSPRMAKFMNENLPGVHVPDDLIKELENAEDPAQKSTEIAARIIRQVRNVVRGIHIMAIGWERYIPRVLEESDLLSNH